MENCRVISLAKVHQRSDFSIFFSSTLFLKILEWCPKYFPSNHSLRCSGSFMFLRSHLTLWLSYMSFITILGWLKRHYWDRFTFYGSQDASNKIKFRSLKISKLRYVLTFCFVSRIMYYDETTWAEVYVRRFLLRKKVII